MKKRSLSWLTSYVITPKLRITVRHTQKERAESIGRISTRLYLESTCNLRTGEWVVDTGVGSSHSLCLCLSPLPLPLAYGSLPLPLPLFLSL